MAKPNPLSQGLNQISQKPIKNITQAVSIAEGEKTTPTRSKRAPSRGGRVLVGGFFSPEVQTALKVIAAEERTTLQALLTEGINTVFVKRGKPEIAGLPVES